jgi:hypothetical protein
MIEVSNYHRIGYGETRIEASKTSFHFWRSKYYLDRVEFYIWDLKDFYADNNTSYIKLFTYL